MCKFTGDVSRFEKHHQHWRFCRFQRRILMEFRLCTSFFRRRAVRSPSAVWVRVAPETANLRSSPNLRIYICRSRENGFKASGLGDLNLPSPRDAPTALRQGDLRGSGSRFSMKALFKKIPVTMRDHLHELTSSELKVWLYLFLRSNEEGTSFPSNKTIADDIGMDRETVKTAKRGLRDKGWTARLKQRKREDGSFAPWWKNPACRGWKIPSRVRKKAATVPWRKKTAAGKYRQQK